MNWPRESKKVLTGRRRPKGGACIPRTATSGSREQRSGPSGGRCRTKRGGALSRTGERHASRLSVPPVSADSVKHPGPPRAAATWSISRSPAANGWRGRTSTIRGHPTVRASDASPRPAGGRGRPRGERVDLVERLGTGAPDDAEDRAGFVPTVTWRARPALPTQSTSIGLSASPVPAAARAIAARWSSVAASQVTITGLSSLAASASRSVTVDASPTASIGRWSTWWFEPAKRVGRWEVSTGRPGRPRRSSRRRGSCRRGGSRRRWSALRRERRGDDGDVRAAGRESGVDLCDEVASERRVDLLVDEPRVPRLHGLANPLGGARRVGVA